MGSEQERRQRIDVWFRLVDGKIYIVSNDTAEDIYIEGPLFDPAEACNKPAGIIKTFSKQ